MRTRLLVGIIILIIGLAMVGGGAIGLRGATTTISSFSQPHAGEYVSSEIDLNSSSVVVVRSAAASGGIIPAQDLSSVSATNYGSYAIPKNSTAGGSDTYIGLKGEYYYVAFATTQPATKIVIAANIAQTAVSGLLVLLGVVFVIAGIIVSVLGLRRKKTKSSTGLSEDDYYAKRGGSGTQPPAPPTQPSA